MERFEYQSGHKSNKGIKTVIKIHVNILTINSNHYQNLSTPFLKVFICFSRVKNSSSIHGYRKYGTRGQVLPTMLVHGERR